MNPVIHLAAVGVAAVAALAGAGAASAWAAQPAPLAFDFNGDGRQDLAAGAPGWRDAASRRAGAVVVLPGARHGVRLAGRQFFARPGVGAPPAGGWLVAALASADFNGDGHADLAVGAPSESADGPDATGVVTVLYGSARGLTSAGAGRLPGPPGSGDGSTSAHFGAALAAGDLNRDGYADLAAGAVFEDPRPDNIDYGSGAIHLLFGGPSGLSPAGQRTIARPNPADATFGQVLALGDVDGDGHIDVVEGAPGSGQAFEASGIPGHTSYCPGGPSGPTSCRTIGAPSPPDMDPDPRGPRRGPASLVVADVTGDRHPDIVEGVPEDRWFGETGPRPAGAVVIYRGTTRGPSAREIVITQNSPGVPGRSEPADAFGTSVQVADLDRAHHADLVVGAPGEAIGNVRRAGRVTVIRGARGGFSRTANLQFDRRAKPLTGSGPELGSALSLLDVDGDRRPELIIGAHGEPGPRGVDYRRATLAILPTTRRGPTPTGARVLQARLLGLSPTPWPFGPVLGG
jgi:FG-GAP repeat